MITILGMWERWENPELVPERRLWKCTIDAFAVDAWGMCDVQGGPFTGLDQYADLATMLAAYPGPKTFLVPANHVEVSTSLAAYVHPADAIYVFGRAGETLVGHVTPADDVVSIGVPLPESDMFAATVLPAVLYDRMAKA